MIQQVILPKIALLQSDQLKSEAVLRQRSGSVTESRVLMSDLLLMVISLVMIFVILTRLTLIKRNRPYVPQLIFTDLMLRKVRKYQRNVL